MLRTPALGARRKPVVAMGLSKTNRIIILLVIDSAFFLLELITGKSLVHSFLTSGRNPLTTSSLGYAVHSLALVADSFHMVRTPNVTSDTI